MTTISVPARPTEVGQRVRASGYGGRVRLWMVGLTGTVVRFNNRGNPVIELDGQWKGPYFLVASQMLNTDTVVDRFGCFHQVTDDGNIIYEDREVMR